MKDRLSVGLELRVEFPLEGTGIARYRDTLREALASMGADLTILAETPLAASRVDAGQADTRLHVERNLFKRAQRCFSLTGRISRVRIENPPDIFHWSHPMPLYLEGARNIYTVHDLIPLHHPRLTGIKPRRFERILRELDRAGASFTAISETTRQEMHDLLPHLGDRLSCTYASVPTETVLGRPSLPLPRDGYFVTIGRVEPRKNIQRLVMAWERAKTGRSLVLIGPDGEGEGMAELRSWLRDRGVIRYPWLPRPQMLDHLVNAHAFLMPSLAEGFGLAAIEAMALGIPAMVSRQGAALEIAGDAAFAIDPLDIDDIAAGIAALSSDNGLREDLIAKGYARASAFAQSNFMDRLRACYRGVPGSLGPPVALGEARRACAS